MNRKPLYRRPWLWIVVLLLLIAGGWFINYRSQTQEAPRDTVAKISKKTDKKEKVAKKPQDKEKDHSLTKPASGEQTEVNGTGQTVNTTVPQQPSIAENTVPANTQEKELWVDPITMSQIRLLVTAQPCIATFRANTQIQELLLKMSSTLTR